MGVPRAWRAADRRHRLHDVNEAVEDEYQAHRRAHEMYPDSAQFRTAYVNGWNAAKNGWSRDECPYGRGSRSRAGWTRAFRNAWLHGYASLA